MLRKFTALAVLALCMLLQTSPASLRALYLESTSLIPVPLPAGIAPVKPPIEADLNHNGSPESLVLADSRLTIYSGRRPVWQSPTGWTVVQAQITDLNQDGTPEATLLVWRRFRPWPVDQWLPHGGRIARFQDGEGNSCQIILVGWHGNEYGELWAGSALAQPVKSFAAADLNADNIQELVTLEGSYVDSRLSSGFFGGLAPAHALKVWEWNGFGFSVVSVMEGIFYKLALVQSSAGRILILVP
jgi:hypothetical protein